MKKKLSWWQWLLALVGILLVALGAGYFAVSRFVSFPSGEAGVADVTLPDGFTINVFAEGLNAPRFMAVGPDGAIYVADRNNNRIVALSDADGDGEADEVRIIAEEIRRPHSLIYHEGAWYVGVTSGIVRLADADGDGVIEKRTAIIDDFPTSGSHSTRTVDFLPDGRMVVSIGSSCNVCEEEDTRRAGIVIYDDAMGGGERIYATGLRNAVGLAIEPETGVLWASNNGRDLMGDDIPPENIYRVEDGGDYGWPRCHSGRIEDPEYGFDGACDDVLPPATEMQAHSAPLGITFYDGDTFPDEYVGDMFIAFHGSWNRSVPTGYKVVRLPAGGDTVVDFATGWLDDATGESSGRPVGVTVGSDGALYVSDDKAGLVYRIQYE